MITVGRAAAAGGQNGATYDAEYGSYKALCEEDMTKRHRFIQKVYSILTLQLLVTAGMVYATFKVEAVNDYLKGNRTVYWIAFAFSFAIIISLSCCTGVARTSPMNYILLAAFTIAEGLMLGVISLYFDSDAVLIAVAMAAGLTIALTLFACQTKVDFTGNGGYWFAALIILIMIGLIAIFTRYKGAILVYSGLGCLIFSMFIVRDTQLILGGNHKEAFGYDDHVFASLSLYLDVVNLVYFLLLFNDNS